MLHLILALLSVSSFANEVPANSMEYRCATSRSEKFALTAVVFEAFDASWKPLYSSAEIRDSAGRIDFNGFVSASRVESNGLTTVIWAGEGFELAAKFIPSNPSRNAGAELSLMGGDKVQLYCTF